MKAFAARQRIVPVVGVLLALPLSCLGECVHVYGGQYDLWIPADPEDSRGWMHDAVVDVLDHLIIRDVDVRISITHTKAFDLRIFLQSPAGRRICLSTYDPFSEYFEGEDYTQTVFDDEADIPIYQGQPPFTGRFRPREPYRLAAFDGEDCFGPWRLQIYDAFYIDAGNLNSFELIITAIEPAMLSLLQPNGGEVLTAGSTTTIDWASTGSVGAVSLEYSIDNGATWAAIDVSDPDQVGSYDWQIPAVDSNQCLVRISDANDPNIGDTSDSVFIIRGSSPRLVVPPTVAALGAAKVQAKTATLWGLIKDDGGEPCQYRFSFWTWGYYCCTGWSEDSDSKTIGQLFSRDLSDLRSGTYYFSAQARNSAGEGNWSDAQTFTVPCSTVRGFTGSGSGTKNDPYIIRNVYELQQIDRDLAACYELANDISAVDTNNWNSGYGFTPIGRYTVPFEGVFDGKGHVIKDLCVKRTSLLCVGLFGCTGKTGEIRYVGLANVRVTGYACVGGLAGFNGGAIKACYVSGNVSGRTQVGGLVGTNNGLITDCYSQGEVFGPQRESSIGGLVGVNRDGALLKNCYSAGRVAGENSGGLAGACGGECIGCFWDIETSGRAASACGIGKTTAQMQTWATFDAAGWSAKGEWTICEGMDYPKLAGQIKPGDEFCPDGVDMLDFALFAARWGAVGSRDLAVLARNWLAGSR